jgi:hypothetical protein
MNAWMNEYMDEYMILWMNQYCTGSMAMVLLARKSSFIYLFIYFLGGLPFT